MEKEKKLYREPVAKVLPACLEKMLCQSIFAGSNNEMYDDETDFVW